MESVVDNDFLDIERPGPFEQWSLRDGALVAARFWGTVGRELDNALIRDLGLGRWAEFVEEQYRVHQREYFLSGCEALGIADVAPDAKKCVLYHCMSTALGGQRSRYAIESDAKAWVFYLPVPLGGAVFFYEVSLPAFRGWYANNGRALGNERLGFVITHLMARGDPYDAGYFIEGTGPVPPEDRCRVRFGEQPPPLSERRAATFDSVLWPEARRLKALRNFAVGWAWDKIVGAGALLGDAGLAAVRTAFEIAVSTQLPYFTAAVGGTGAAMVARYFAAVHQIAGLPVSTTEANAGVRVELGRDPVAQSSFELSEAVAAATHDRIRTAWAAMTSEYGVVIDGGDSTHLVFRDA